MSLDKEAIRRFWGDSAYNIRMGEARAKYSIVEEAFIHTRFLLDENDRQAEEIESLRAELERRDEDVLQQVTKLNEALAASKKNTFAAIRERDAAYKQTADNVRRAEQLERERDEARQESGEYKSGAAFWSDYAKGLEIKLEKQQQAYEVLLDIVRGFVIWEDMFPVRKNYNKTEPCRVDDDYETYRFNVDAARRLLAQYDTAQPKAACSKCGCTRLAESPGKANRYLCANCDHIFDTAQPTATVHMDPNASEESKKAMFEMIKVAWETYSGPMPIVPLENTSEVQRLREALKYYADFANWHWDAAGDGMISDGGQCARAALSPQKGETPDDTR